VPNDLINGVAVKIMKENPLSVVQVDANQQKSSSQGGLNSRLVEAEAKYERLWHLKPERLDPGRSAIGSDRVKHTISIVEQLFDMKDLSILDIGCGTGALAIAFAKEGSRVTAADIASNALKLVSEHPNITKVQAALPKTPFSDDEFDVCIAAEVIAEMDHRDYRLAMAELCRLIKPDGRVICSNSIDIYSEDAFIRFRKLAETEFKILHWKFSYHALYLHILHFLKAPSKFFKAWRHPDKRDKGLKHRRGLSRWWFKINSTLVPALIWAPISWILSPAVYTFEKSELILHFFEKICRFFLSERGISHVIFVGKRRPLLEERDEPPIPDRPPFKREVRWE